MLHRFKSPYLNPFKKPIDLDLASIDILMAGIVKGYLDDDLDLKLLTELRIEQLCMGSEFDSLPRH